MTQISHAALKYPDAKRETEIVPASQATCTTTTSELFASINDDFKVTEENALRISAVYACIKVLSEGVMLAPIQLMHKKDNKRKKAINHSLYSVLYKKPNFFQTPSDFKKMFVAHMCLTGAFYAQIIRTNGGDIKELIPLNPTKMYTTFQAGELKYFYWGGAGNSHILNQEDVFKVIGQSLDGITPVSPIRYQEDSLNLSKKTEKHGIKYFDNDATPPIAIMIPEELSDLAFERFKQSVNEASSRKNKHRPMILEGGADIKKIGLSPEDSQLLESRRYEKQEISSIFKVPPHMISDLSKATFSNIEQQDLNFTKFSLMPYFIAFEEAADIQLLDKSEWNEYYFKFNANALLRGDFSSRMEGYEKGRNMGMFSVNDLLEFEDMNPVDNGDGRLQPLNFTQLGANPTAKGDESA